MLKVNSISKSYQGKENALQNVSFAVKAGEVCGLLGNNGAGKSSIIRSIVGAQSFDRGEITIGGQSVQKHGEYCKSLLGYIPDNQAIYPYLTGRQYLDFVSSFYPEQANTSEERIQHYAEYLNLSKDLNKPISAYSKGMKQKLLIISAIMHLPKLIIMDEPFSGLDPATVNQLIQIVKEERDRGAAILFSSHMLDIARKISDRFVVIKEGMVVVDTPANQIEQFEYVEKMLIGEQYEEAI